MEKGCLLIEKILTYKDSQPANVLFRFTLTALMVSTTGSRFPGKTALKTRITLSAQHRRSDRHSYRLAGEQRLAAEEPEISLRSRWRQQKKELNESEYWTYVHQVTGNTTQMSNNVCQVNICQCCVHSLSLLPPSGQKMCYCRFNIWSNRELIFDYPTWVN